MDKIQSNNQNFGNFLDTGGLENANSRAGSRCSTRMDVSGELSPVSWAGEEDVIFLAEQVSHHPPISAFYAESLKKRIQVTGHFLAKSNMKGFSAVAAHLRSLRADDPSNKGHSRPIEQNIEF